jgi:hypothetical protein
MAWDEYNRDGRTLLGGDVPLGELALALRRIGTEYQARFQRLPLVDEILLALEQALAIHPERLVADPEGLDAARLRCERPAVTPRRHVDPERYEAGFDDEPAPGRYVVEQKAPGARREVLVVPRLDLNGRLLEVDYRIVDAADVDDDVAEQLVLQAILDGFSDGYYRGQADEVALTNLDTGARRTVPYR